MKKVPLWVVASLGKPVALVGYFCGPCGTYPPGSVGTLDAIAVKGDNTGFYASVALDAHDLGYLEPFEFSEIAPTTATVKFSLDLEEGCMSF